MLKTDNLFNPTGLNNNDSQISKAKEYPIEDVYKGDLKRVGSVKMGACPKHEDKTPSFAIYPKTNTFYCFSCEFGGDVINLYMELNNCDFNTAIKELTE